MEKLIFEFGKYTEITDLVFSINPELRKEKYVRFFICPDVTDFWLVRVLEGVNENYENEDGTFLIERNNIWKSKGEDLTLAKVNEIIREDDGSNWDIQESASMEDVIEIIDGGWGINNLKEEEGV